MKNVQDSSLTKFEKRIIRLIKEHSSVVWIKTHNKELVYNILEHITSGEGYKSENLCYKIEPEKILVWNIAYGRRSFVTMSKDDDIIEKLDDTIRSFTENKVYKVLVLDDISLLLQGQEESKSVISWLQEFSYKNTYWKKADRKKGVRPINQKTILIIAPQLEIIESLNHLIEIVEEPVPDEMDIKRELGFDRIDNGDEDLKTITRSNKPYKYGRYEFSPAFMKHYDTQGKKLVSALKGMYMYDIRKLLYSLLIHSKPEGVGLNIRDADSKKFLSECVSDEKKRIVQNSGLLQVIDINVDKQKERVGNIDNLRSLLESQKTIIDNIENYNETMPKPKGILLVGAPGCGKSEAAKSVAAILEKPLLRLDIGALMGQYVGVSEHNLIEAIKIAEAAQPCVLWIDEIEKAFAGFGNSDSGNDITVMRMVGYFLTWMQERKTLVYLVATANNLDNLRPELLRKGRWDKIMYLSYPKKTGIVDIFSRCLKKYKLKIDVSTELSSDGRAKDAEFENFINSVYAQEMSGADIDSVIVEAYNKEFTKSKGSSIDTISIATCMDIVLAANTLQARKDSDAELVNQSMINYKINSGRFDWDEEQDERLQQAINEYRLSSGNIMNDIPFEEQVKDAIADIKISLGKTNIENEPGVRKLIESKIRKKLEQEKRIKDLLLSKVESSFKDKERVRIAFEEQLAHKGREEQEKYYKSKGYESAS